MLEESADEINDLRLKLIDHMAEVGNYDEAVTLLQISLAEHTNGKVVLSKKRHHEMEELLAIYLLKAQEAEMEKQLEEEEKARKKREEENASAMKAGLGP